MRIWNTTSEAGRRLRAWLIVALALGAFEVQAQSTGFDAVLAKGQMWCSPTPDASTSPCTARGGVGFQRGTFDGALSSEVAR